MINEYIPHPAIIESIQDETFDTKTFKVVFEDKKLAASFDHKPGQFAQHGAKTPDELCFKQELKSWQGVTDTEVLITVDRPDERWNRNVGVVTTLWHKTDMTSSGGVAYVCGPPIMIRFVIRELIRTGFEDDNIYISLERYMKCGIGKCGHCNIGAKFVCIDGPVFSYSQLKRLPDKDKAMAI